MAHSSTRTGRDVGIVGIGQVKVGEHWEKGLRHLALDALQAAMLDAGVDRVDAIYVGNALAGRLNGQTNLGPLIADFAGMQGTEAIGVEASGASGAAALRQGYIAVASGVANVSLVVGVEKMTDAVSAETTAALAMGLDSDHETDQGLSLAAASGLLMRRYIYEHGCKDDAFAPFPINAHANAVNNPYAQFGFPIAPEAYARAGMVATPVNMLDAFAVADGAAAVVLAPTDWAEGLAKQAIRITASAIGTDAPALHDRQDPLTLRAAAISAEQAYQQAEMQPQDIDLFELHDAFSITAALSLEACGFAERGQAVDLAQAGEIGINGRIPISTMGGLKARGNPIGATGIYQVLEVVQQLREQAGANQVEDARVGMVQNIGGSGATAVTHILERTN
jgi:acetyl-CoA C-acetyltransferase